MDIWYTYSKTAVKKSDVDHSRIRNNEKKWNRPKLGSIVPDMGPFPALPEFTRSSLMARKSCRKVFLGCQNFDSSKNSLSCCSYVLEHDNLRDPYHSDMFLFRFVTDPDVKRIKRNEDESKRWIYNIIFLSEWSNFNSLVIP